MDVGGKVVGDAVGVEEFGERGRTTSDARRVQVYLDVTQFDPVADRPLRQVGDLRKHQTVADPDCYHAVSALGGFDPTTHDHGRIAAADEVRRLSRRYGRNAPLHRIANLPLDIDLLPWRRHLGVAPDAGCGTNSTGEDDPQGRCLHHVQEKHVHGAARYRSADQLVLRVDRRSVTERRTARRTSIVQSRSTTCCVKQGLPSEQGPTPMIPRQKTRMPAANWAWKTAPATAGTSSEGQRDD